MTALSAGTLLISNLAAIKLWNLAGVAVDGGLVLFPLTYILGDLIIEFFGLKISKSVVYSGFLINLIAVAVFYIVIGLPPFPGWEMQNEYTMVLGFSPRIIFGSLFGFVLSNLFNNWVFQKMKESDENSIWRRSFIARALGSSAVARVLDSGTFEFIAFFGVLPLNEFVKQAVFAYFLGMGLEVLLSPFEAVVQKVLKRYVEE